MILDKVETLNNEELLLLSNLFIEISDTDMLDILTNKLKGPKKYQNLISKIINE